MKGPGGSPNRLRPTKGFGQALTLMVIALPAFVGAMGLAVDVGNFYFNYYRAQTAVDAAALAGATCLSLPASCTAGASSTATSYAKNNDSFITLDPDPVAAPVTNSFCPGGPACQITVSATQTVPYYFARLVGVTSGVFNVTATATGGPMTSFTAPSSGTNNLMPIGLDYTSVFTNNSSVTPIAYKFSAGPGNWGFLDLGGSCGRGDSGVSCNIQNGYSGTLNVWDGTSSPASQPSMFVTTSPGVGTKFKAMNTYRYTPCSGQTATSHPADSPCAICLPLVDWSYDVSKACTKGTCTVPVKGFAEMWVDSVTDRGASSSITATWISSLCPGGSFSPGSPPGIKDGAIAIEMLQ